MIKIIAKCFCLKIQVGQALKSFQMETFISFQVLTFSKYLLAIIQAEIRKKLWIQTVAKLKILIYLAVISDPKYFETNLLSK